MRSPQNSFVNTGKCGKDESCGKGGKSVISCQLSVVGCQLGVIRWKMTRYCKRLHYFIGYFIIM